ncbi:MAG TPA: hypothetical protein VIN63_11010 [Candidatus Limnocylindria bacterium]|jgi:hypothetical protein
MNDRVDFVCARAEHQGSELDDVLTMHEDLWAYCPGGAREHHDWRPTGGMSLEDAKQFVRRQPIRQVDARVQRSD